jgi:hypothetical protein
MSTTHQPIVPDALDDSTWRRFRRFLPLAFAYSLRHLTIGTVIRFRRRTLKWRGAKYYI